MYLQNVWNTIRKKEKEKGLTKLIRLFGKCDRSNRCKGGNYCSWFSLQKNNQLSRLLLRTLDSRLIWALSRSSKMGAALDPSLSLCIFRLP